MLVKGGTATLKEATACLHQLQNYVRSLPTSEAREEVHRLGAGGHVLDWLWQRYSPTDRYIPLDRDLADLLCWFLLPEGRKQYVWNWLKIVVLEIQKQGRADSAYNWALRLLGGLAKAHGDWAHGGSPDDALRCLETAFNEIYTKEEYDPTALPLLAMVVTIEKYLKRNNCPPADAELFEMFRSKRNHWSEHSRKKWNDAQLMLYHPTGPDAQAFCQAFRESESFLDKHMLQSLKHNALHKLAAMMLRASYILRLQGAVEDDEWLQSIVKANSPMIWGQRHGEQRAYEKDRKLDRLRATVEQD